MNEKQQIQELLNRYMAGLSTPEDNDRLASYFRTHEVDEEWKAYKLIFAYFDHDMNVDEVKDIHHHVRLVSWISVAAAAVIAILFLILHYTDNAIKGNDGVTAEVVQKAMTSDKLTNKRENTISSVEVLTSPTKTVAESHHHWSKSKHCHSNPCVSNVDLVPDSIHIVTKDVEMRLEQQLREMAYQQDKVAVVMDMHNQLQDNYICTMNILVTNAVNAISGRNTNSAETLKEKNIIYL